MLFCITLSRALSKADKLDMVASYCRKGIQSAGYIPFEIRNEPHTNCLLPTPLTNKWQDACGKEDSYCIDYQDVYSSGTVGLKETLDSNPGKFKSCIKPNER